ncbi:vascular endothelial growth factor receptor 1 isoform X4 [Hyposmocoma kahamanoa]|uniref:vascular endothelial growth factor receptor 1 isoform X4 n=1 Tax=Hyposmocoma kahamanoa TaxID=1477025 RepID=UPI000E6D733B|nr:vascular endothelial growth factor receptor 1 isoform X4 [Hyposmocoma kahamanoa]
MIMGWSLLASLMTSVLLVASNETADIEDLGGPVFTTPNKSEIILQAGQNYTLLCRANRPVTIKQQDIPEEVTSNFKTVMQYGNVNEDLNKYEVALNLYNVDHSAVGYYGCFDSTMDSQQVLKEIDKEPSNTKHISYVYVYVNGTTWFAPMKEFIVPKSSTNIVIECKPSSPDINVTLTMGKMGTTNVKYEGYNPKVGFIISNNILPDTLNDLICEYRRHTNFQSTNLTVVKHVMIPPPQPQITSGSKYFLEGETFSLNCSVPKQRNSAMELKWTIPGFMSKVENHSNTNMQDERLIWYNNYTIYNASREDAGNYTCTSKNVLYEQSQSFWKEYLEEAVIDWKPQKTDLKYNLLHTKMARIAIDIQKAYPKPTYNFYKNNAPLPNVPGKYVTSIKDDIVVFAIKNLSVADSDNYTIEATNNKVTKSLTFDVRLRGAPKIIPEPDKTVMLHSLVSLICEVIAYPLPNIDWIFTDEFNNETYIKSLQIDRVDKIYKITSELKIEARLSGNITCKATNEYGSDNSTRQFFVQEMPGGFGIENANHTWYPENENVEIRCLASVYDFDNNLTWFRNDEPLIDNVEYSKNPFSYIATLNLSNIQLNQAGRYTCKATRIDGIDESEEIEVIVSALQPPAIEEPQEQVEEVFPFQLFNFSCNATAIPPPHIEWYKDQERLIPDEKLMIIDNRPTKSTLTSTLKIASMSEELAGKYECRVLSNGEMRSKFYTLAVNEKFTNKTTYLIVIGVIFFLLILLVAYLTWKIKKEKQFRKELAAAGLLYFKEGVKKSINPDLGIDEQAELLPYDDKFEFPSDKLVLGKQLGAGAFGVVYKAEARGIINAEETTTVAVKMVKKTADNMYIKALASELKIMVHLGKHINIVNLLGACTKNVGKRELIVIVEYCKFGNIHNYLQKHREVFVDQLNENSEKTVGKVNRGFSCSSGNSGNHSDYFGSNHTQDTDHTFLNTATTNRSCRKDNHNKQVELVKVSESGYVQPEWRSNYESDYSFDGRSPRPLCSRDLLAWAFQIARGMEYLASRKVLHGDLAARNILLADDNVVKICDFGLARSIYKNDEYQKKENSPLPVKWLAIECMTDRIFSTQSDVWSFGIVLWELFSLAKTPYPNISPPSLLQWLSEGNRLEKPVYADDKLYDVMKSCWNQKPTARPSFTKLQETLGSFLEDHVRNHYVDLNAMYVDMNSKRETEDYLAMVSAPDYNNLVTPSPHHYVNDYVNFFPTAPQPLQHGESSYVYCLFKYCNR